jgi:hypothetical protein
MTIQLTRISVTLGRTINMGNFESARVETTLEAVCDEVAGSVEHKRVARALTQMCDEQLDRIQRQLEIEPPEGG